MTNTSPRIAALTLSAVFATTAMVALSPTTALAIVPGGYADLVETVSPAVVYVEVTGKASVKPAGGAMPEGDMLEEFKRRFGGQMPQQDRRPMKGAGSGFIIDASGLIVTNNHVVESAKSITVKFADGTTLDATVVGSDPLTDIALLQVESDTPLAVVEFGSSEDLRVGDEVIAMGSPFGLAGTVTSGIVSATSRNINSGPFDDYIQTDAAINKGNSGGPLFDANGDVVGVNTAIFSPDGGSVGIGFAVPSDLVQEIIADLKDDGKVDRGWLGVQIRPISAETASALGYDEGKGVVIESVVKDSPASEAHLKSGDIILQFNGTEITELRDLTRAVAQQDPDQKVEIEVLRKGEKVTLDVTLANRAGREA
ncbi:MAG: serine protease Do [Paracoccaceae bacterium]|jgi:serine protease Do